MKPFGRAPVGPKVGYMDEASVNVCLGEDFDGIKLDEVLRGTIGRDSENSEVGLADDWFAFAKEKIQESGEHDLEGCLMRPTTPHSRIAN